TDPSLRYAHLMTDLAERPLALVVSGDDVPLPVRQGHEGVLDVVPEILLEERLGRVRGGLAAVGHQPIERESGRHRGPIGRAFADLSPEDPSTAVEPAELVDDGATDTRPGEALERHAARGV